MSASKSFILSKCALYTVGEYPKAENGALIYNTSVLLIHQQL